MATDAPAAKKLAVLDWLLAQRVHLEACDHVECTALHCAAALGEAELALRLLKAGASPRARDAEGLTPLHLAARAAALRQRRCAVACDSADRAPRRRPTAATCRCSRRC